MAAKTRKRRTRIRTGDMVQVIGGDESGLRVVPEGGDEKERGRRGKVLVIDFEKNRATVQGLRMVKKHQKLSRDPSRPNVGRIEKEAPIALDSLMVVCPKCDRPTRLGIRQEEHEREGGKVKVRRIRVCKKCGADIPERK